MFYRKLIDSFYNASEGIVYTIATQRNMKIHISFALLVLLLGMGLHFVYSDVIIILFAIGIVMAAEAFNTSIETVVDLVTGEYHKKAKIAKDVAAGSVLLTVIIAILVGLITIFPYLKRLIEGREVHEGSFSSFFVLLTLFLLLFIYVVKALWYDKDPNYQPHVMLSILLIFLGYLFINSFYTPLIFVFFLNSVYVIYLIKNNLLTFIGLSQNILIVFGGIVILTWLFL